MKITKISELSGKESSREIDITEEQLARVGGRELIQNIVPHLSADDREFLKTGITPEEWDEVFPKDDEDDDDYDDDYDDGTYDYNDIDEVEDDDEYKYDDEDPHQYGEGL